MKTIDKKFDAVLAKNQIARLVKRSDLPLGTQYAIFEHLKAIELVIGQANQPSVEDLEKSDGYGI